MKLIQDLGNSLMKLVLYPVFAKYVSMPGKSHEGPLEELDEVEQEIAENSLAVVTTMAVDIGERSINTPNELNACADFIETSFRELGYDVVRQPFEYRGIRMYNLIAELPGTTRPDEVFVLGAHYDTVIGTPGADDNATGVAALLEHARLLKDLKLSRTVRFVAFGNEENNGDGPYVMGSYHYAKACHEAGDNIVGMISLEMLGCYKDTEGSQLYPFPFSLFYPKAGSFIGFVGNIASAEFVKSVVAKFRETTKFPSEGACPPEKFSDISRSDHSSFWYFGYPALMATDTSNFRYEHVHMPEDTPDKVDFPKMARVVNGILKVVIHLTK